MISSSAFAGSAFGYFGAAKSSATVATLQRALAQLALAKRDSALAVGPNGVIGPKTVAAANRALVKYAVTAPSALRKGNLSAAQVVTNAGVIASYIAQAARVVAPKVAPKAAPKVAARPVTKPPATKAAPKVTVVAVSKVDVKRLQTALRVLSPLVHDKTLLIGADGVIGPQTVAAVNKAFTTVVAAPANFRTGALTAAMIGASVKTLAQLAEAEVSVRRKAKVTKTPVPPAVKTPLAPKRKPAGNPAVATLQQLLVQVGEKINDSVLRAVGVDGLIGPKTVTATNRALSKYATIAPKNVRTGKLTQAQVLRDLTVITGYLQKTVAAGVPGVDKIPEQVSQQTPEMTPPGNDSSTMPDVEPYQPATAPASSVEAAKAKQAQEDPQAAEPTADLPPFPEAAAAAFTPSAASSPSSGGGASSGGGGGGSLTPAAADEKTPAPTEEETQAALSPKKMFPWKPVLIGGGGAAVLGTAAYFLFRSPPKSSYSRLRRRTA